MLQAMRSQRVGLDLTEPTHVHTQTQLCRCFSFLWAVLRGMWDLGSPTRY